MTKIINGVASEFEFPADTGVFTQNVLKKENEILRKNAEHNDKVVDKVNWENMLLKKENQELKKQLEDANEKIILLQASEPMLNYKKALEETQQKEFILYLRHLSNWYSADGVKQGIVNEILQKYKEIIGDDK